jgi:sigma-B regulation protein RsbU (phosphoserine phosphatase)
MVTDGVTEAASPDGEEFGDDRVCEALVRRSGGSAAAVLDGLVAAVDCWAGAGGLGDDLTALVLKDR